jgi:hypothetical protein
MPVAKEFRMVSHSIARNVLRWAPPAPVVDSLTEVVDGLVLLKGEGG